MTDFADLSFVIPGYTPETIPFGRLIQYLNEMLIIIGNPEDLHLVEIKDGSIVPVFHGPVTVISEAREYAERIRHGKESREQRDAYNNIRHMLREDAPDTGMPAILSSANKIVLEIPVAAGDLGEFQGIWQVATIDGKLIQIGNTGEDEYAIVKVQDFQGEIISDLKVDRVVAKRLTDLLWKPVRLTGFGLWKRTSTGKWWLKSMYVQSYEPLIEEDLKDTLERLRSLKVKWPEDALDRLREEREDSA